MEKKILVTIPVEEKHKIYLEEKAPGAVFTYGHRKSVTAAEVKDTQIILGDIPPELVKEAVNLEFLQLDSAGAVPYTVPGVMRAGVKLANGTGAYGPTISEYMLGSVLYLQKKLYLYAENMKKHEWKNEGIVNSIEGSVTLVVGLGDIGSAFAEKMKSLGSYVIGIRRNRTKCPECVDELYLTEDLDQVLPRADIIACSLPGTRETEGMFSAERMKKVKQGALFLNVGRGNLISSQVLLEALTSGQLGGAVIDVAEQEPLPSDSMLWDAPNLLITPHVSGNYHTRQILERAVKIAGSNLESFLAGKPLHNEVDMRTGYRKFTGISE